MTRGFVRNEPLRSLRSPRLALISGHAQRRLSPMPNQYSRRQLLHAIGIAAAARPLSALAQGRCMLTLGSPSCVTTATPPPFEPTGWKTVALDHFTFRVADYQKEAAFYAALMGWKPRSDDGKQAVMDLGDWGTAIFRQAPADSFEAPSANEARGRGAQATPVRAVVESFCFV